MQYTRLGSTGLKVSRICLGTMTYGSSRWRHWVYDEAESLPFFKQALESGINFFDTADFYSIGVCEEVVGKALKEYANRDEIVLASKLFYSMSDEHYEFVRAMLLETQWKGVSPISGKPSNVPTNLSGDMPAVGFFWVSDVRQIFRVVD